jgi:hypothetical protein
MSKYRIVKHQAGDVIRYCPEVWECRAFIGKCQESWWKLAGNENLTSLDLWVKTLPKTIEDAKDIIENHIEDQKPKYSEEVVYEYDTKNPRGMISKQPLEEAAEIEKIAMDKLKSKWEHLYTFGYPQKPFPTNYENDLNNVKVGLYEGANWMQERMYSEKEVESLLHKYMQSQKPDWHGWSTTKWFEQYKKK